MKKLFWIIPVALFALIACDKKEENTEEPLTHETLQGLWVADYADSGRDGDRTWTRAVEDYQFLSDGTGYYECYLIDGNQYVKAISVRDEGALHYTMKGNTVTVKGDGSNQIQTFTYADGKLTLKGVAFQKATAEQQTLVDQLYADWQGANSVSDEIAYVCYTWDGLQLVKETVVEKPQGCLNHIDESQDYRTLSGTWYVTGEHDIDDVVLYVEKGKTLNIVLCDGASLTTGNIMVNGEGTTLRIFAQERGTGKLHINDEIDAPSIGPGGQNADSGGVIEIHGGNLTQDDSDQNPAIGNYAVMLTHYDLKRIAIYGGTLNLKGDAAGIGGHFYRSYIPTIDIYGGDITARSLDNDAGIGGYSSDVLSISIYGGTVRAYGGSGGAGIGNREGAPRDGGYVNIFGGTVTAKGGMGAAGIGGGDRNSVDVYIHGGTVNAYAGNDGAGIGGGEDGDRVYITIFGGVVRAYGGRNPDGSGSNGYGAGIGSGQDGSVNKIIIKGGDIEAYGGMDAAGIGTGEEYRIQGINSGTIEIHGGRVYAKGGGYGAGIGSGQDASVGTIRIYGGDVTAYGGEDAAGIGTGEEYERDGIISGTIEIYGGKVYAYGKGYGAGIGAGEDATFGLIGISGGYVEAHAGSDCGNWSGGIGAYHDEHEDGCHIGWAGWERIWIGACMRLWTYSPYNGYWENVHYTENWWDFVHQRPWVAFGECNHVDGAYDITNCPYCHSYTLTLQ